MTRFFKTPLRTLDHVFSVYIHKLTSTLFLFSQLTWLKFRNTTLRVLGASVLCSQSLVHDVMTTYDKQNDVTTDEDVARAQTRSAECRMTMQRMAEQYKAALEDCKAVNVPHVSFVWLVSKEVSDDSSA